MANELISRETLAGHLRVHPRTISRSIERQGLGTPIYAANGEAMFRPSTLCAGLSMSPKFLRDIVTGKDVALSPKEAATILRVSLVDLYDRIKRTGAPRPTVRLSAGIMASRATKRFSRNDVVNMAANERALVIGRAA